VKIVTSPGREGGFSVRRRGSKIGQKSVTYYLNGRTWPLMRIRTQTEVMNCLKQLVVKYYFQGLLVLPIRT